jgi:formiminoglutamate deiminase
VTTYRLERAWVGGAVRDDVEVEIEGGRFVRVEVGGVSGGDPSTVPGLTLPGLANTHSHVFHRALRGRTQRGRGSFWTWRTQMYDVAGRLDPDSMFVLARAVYREMVAAGTTVVGEFHYLHHQPDGTPYAEPNAMGEALAAAAREAGIRITLLDTLYLSAGFGEPLEGVQRRFGDGDVAAWLDRAGQRRADRDHVEKDHVVLGHALHSVRAVPATALAQVGRELGAAVHVHLSEQVAENEACLAAYGVTPARLLAEHGLLGPETTLVHATHLTAEDVALLGERRAFVSACPTTERDLADGIGPLRALHEAGARLTLGSDSHAVIDPFEEMRACELDERLATGVRGHWRAAELLDAGTVTGHASLGWDDAGQIAVGHRADLVTLDLASPRTAGTGGDEQTAVFGATAADVTFVLVDGRVVVRQGEAEELRRAVGRELDEAITEVWR